MNVNSAFGPFVAFLAGLLSFLSPCVLPLVPVYLARIAGTAADGSVRSRRVTFTHACSFVGGFSLIFIGLGAGASLLGYSLGDHKLLLAQVAGVAIIVMGLHLTGILKIPALYRTFSVPIAAGAGAGGGTISGGGGSPGRLTVLGYGRSALVGAGFAFGWTPCVGPVLGTILGLAQFEGQVAKGTLLLAFYSLGLGVPFLITGMAVGTVTAQLKKVNRFLPAIEMASGVLLILVGILLVANRMTMFNQYFDFFGIGSQGGL